MKKTKVMRELLEQPGLIVMPGVSNAFLARIVENAGFPVMYVSGAGMANMNFCLPDYNFISMTENLEIVKRINDAVTCPILCDIDDGYGSYGNVYRTLREYSKAGIAAVQMEDQKSPKRCGHFEGHQVIPASQMCGKIKAARDGSEDDDLVIVARTDAISATGSFDEAVERMGMYIEAGADVVFIEAVRNKEQMEKIPTLFDKPCLINLVEHGKTPILSNSEYEQMGYKFALYACQTLKAAAWGVEQFLEYLKENGTSDGCDNKLMITSEHRHEITDKAYYEDLIKKYESEE